MRKTIFATIFACFIAVAAIAGEVVVFCPGAVHGASKDKKAAEELIQFLITPAAKDKFKALGFTVS